jgi:iron-sulfur cluster assembly protein
MISLTEKASNRVKQTLTKRGKGLGIRIGVKTTGCSGLAYVLEYVDSPQEHDITVDCNGCTLFIDPKSGAYVQGLEIDFVRNGLNEGFEFNNPNERDRCGCGESFRI